MIFNPYSFINCVANFLSLSVFKINFENKVIDINICSGFKYFNEFNQTFIISHLNNYEFIIYHYF